MGVNGDMLRGFHDLMILYRLSLSDSYGHEISKYIRSFSRKETRGRKQTYYELTEEGIQRYQNLVDDWLIIQNIVNHFLKE